MKKFRVDGEITFAERAELPPQAKAYVRLLDTSLADAAAKTVAEAVFEDIARKVNEGETIKFILEGEIQDERGDYTVSAHIDADGDGKMSPGDFISMQSYPVITHGSPSQVTVQVKKI